MAMHAHTMRMIAESQMTYIAKGSKKPVNMTLDEDSSVMRAR